MQSTRRGFLGWVAALFGGAAVARAVPAAAETPVAWISYEQGRYRYADWSEIGATYDEASRFARMGRLFIREREGAMQYGCDDGHAFMLWLEPERLLADMRKQDKAPES